MTNKLTKTQKKLSKMRCRLYRGNIFKNMMIFSKKLEKRKVFILKEKDAGLAIKSMNIEMSMLRNLISDPRHIF